MVCSRNQKSTNVLRCLRVGTLTGCPLRSNKERISSAMMLHFFPSAVFITRQWGENDDAFFKTAIDIFSIRKTLVSDHFDKLAFSLNKKFTDDVIFSHAEMLTGCPLDANNIIKFRAYRRLICCYPPRVTRNLGGDEHGLFVVDEYFFMVCTRQACGRVHSIFFCCPGFGLHAHLL